MKKWLALLTVILTAAAAVAQSIPASQSRVAGRFVAYNYGLWNTYPASISPATGLQTFTVINSYVNLGDGRLISPFSTNAPLRIGTETVTPSAVANCFVNDVRIGVCQITATFTLSHTNSDKISSATFGLQEALNDAGNSGGGAVTVDSAWAGVGGTTAMINGATIPANTSIEDARTGVPAGPGAVTPSPQFSLFYQPHSGTAAAAVGDPNITTDGAGNLHAGTVVAGTSVSAPVIGLTGSTPARCIHTDSSGNLVTTSADCGSGGGNSGVTVVTCAGSNDTAALNTALAGAGHVVINPNVACVLNTTGTSHITIPSNTTLSAYGASITYNGGGAGTDYLIGNTQVARTIARTCTDVVMTSGSVNITSATCNFSQGDVENDSISCIGAYAGGLAYGVGTMGTDLHTTIANVTNSTTAALADPPSAVSNPMTCNIYTRDKKITIEGGTWTNTTASTQGGSTIKIVTANNVTVRDVTIIDGSSTVPSGGTGFEIYPADLSNFLFENITFGGWNQGADGLHLLGPARSGTIRHMRGHSGDDMVPVSAADGNMTGGANAQLEGRVYGVVDGLLIEDIDGSSYANEAAVKLFGPTGSPIPIRNVTMRHFHAAAPTCPLAICGSSGNKPGFGNMVWLFSGDFDAILVEDISGTYVENGVIVGAATNIVQSVGSLTVKDVSQDNYVFEANTYHLVAVVQGSQVSSLVVSGIKSANYNNGISLLVDVLSTVKRLQVLDSQFGNLTGGVFTPFNLFGTFDDIIIDGVQFNYTSGNTTPGSAQGIINLQGAKANHVSLDHVHVTYQAGTVSGGIALLQIGVFQPGSIAPAIGDITMNDVALNAPVGAGFNEYLLYQNGGTLVSYTISNSRTANIAGCVGGVTVAGQILNQTTTGLSVPASCNTFSNGIPTVVGTPATLTNQGAAITATTLYTSTSASQLLRVDCSLYTGSTTGTGTANVSVLWNNSTAFSTSPNLIFTANAIVNFSPIFVQTTSGQTVKYQTAFTAGTGGSYNLTCGVTRLQ